MASNGFQGSYANERPGPPSSTGSGEGPEAASDPASSSFFLSDYRNRKPASDVADAASDPARGSLFGSNLLKHDDLKQMLDSNKDNLKLEAMKRIIGMVAKGKDASDLFPAVVKNVVSKNIEVKKLVYVYLTRYAEEQQDLALLSISTFQRALKDPNQLIRASALRVLSSIRVSMIVPIMMLAIKEAVMDMSPYVRKTAAHAIPKLYSMDPEQKDILIEVIEKLLADKTTLVAGSAIQAFEEVCPERNDLIHKNYRKLCNLLVDVEEWGQVVIINMLTRYARTQFVNPNQEDATLENEDKAFYDSEDSEKSSSDKAAPQKKVYVMDADHRLLLRASKPLLNSRNSAVVMAVAQLYHHCAPKAEVGLVAKALIRLLRSHKEVQYMVLSNIASMSILRRGMFEPYLKSFYVRSSDPTHVKLLKLEILTNLATETNISTILREFQTYVTSSDEEFAASTIQAIGRCASSISEITDTCLNGLVSLLSNRNEAVVGESVVVIKKLLQTEPTEHKEIIQHLAKLAESISVPMARASILWLIGEYSDRVPKIAPDVLRKMAKTFIEEEDIVKLQILNLAAKLCITNPKQTKLLCQYVLNLAKYDQNYDIRDRARFLRQLILPSGDKPNSLSRHAKKIFLATKPAPVLESKFKDRDQYQLGTLSHIINAKAQGYQELPEWPETAPDPSVRNVEVTMPWTETRVKAKKPDKKRSFYSSESSSEEESSSGSGSGSETSGSEASGSSGSESASSSGESSESESESESESGSSTSGSGDEESTPKNKAKKTTPNDTAKKAGSTASESGESSEGSESETEDSSEDSSEEEPPPVKKSSKNKHSEKKSHSNHSKSKEPPSYEKPSQMLLDLDDFGPSVTSVPALSPGSLLTPSSASSHHSPSSARANYSVLSPVYTPTHSFELLNKMSGGGLACMYRFTRTVSVFSPKMTSIELTFTNFKDSPISSIKFAGSKLAPGMTIQEFPEITNLGVNATLAVLMAVDFNDTTQPAKFTIRTPDKSHELSITAPVGELLSPNTLTEGDFLKLQKRLAGMNENSCSVELPESNQEPQEICNVVYSTANVAQVGSSQPETLRFAGRTISSGSDALITITKLSSSVKAKVTVNCEKMVIGSMLLKDLKSSLIST